MRKPAALAAHRDPLPRLGPEHRAALLEAVAKRLDLFYQLGLGGTFEVDFDKEQQKWTVRYTLVDRDPLIENRTALENSE